MFGNEKLYYQLMIVSGAGEGNGLYSYSYDAPKQGASKEGAYYCGRYKINLGFNNIFCWELSSVGHYVEHILYEKINNEWQCIDGKNPPPKEVETIQLDAVFVEKNIQIKDEIKPLYDTSCNYSCSVMEMIKEVIEEEFIVGILMSMLFCSHMSLSAMFVHQEWNNSDEGWLTLICEQCDEKWKGGTFDDISINKIKRIHIKYKSEWCGKGRSYGARQTFPYHSLENKRKEQETKTTETK
eukprot:522164_1